MYLLFYYSVYLNLLSNIFFNKIFQVIKNKSSVLVQCVVKQLCLEGSGALTIAHTATR